MDSAPDFHASKREVLSSEILFLTVVLLKTISEMEILIPKLEFLVLESGFLTWVLEFLHSKKIFLSLKNKKPKSESPKLVSKLSFPTSKKEKPVSKCLGLDSKKRFLGSKTLKKGISSGFYMVLFPYSVRFSMSQIPEIWQNGLNACADVFRRYPEAYTRFPNFHALISFQNGYFQNHCAAKAQQHDRARQESLNSFIVDCGSIARQLGFFYYHALRNIIALRTTNPKSPSTAIFAPESIQLPCQTPYESSNLRHFGTTSPT